MRKKLLLFAITLCILFTACQQQKLIDYTIDEADHETILKYNGRWTSEEYEWIQKNKDRYIVFACAKDYTPIEYLDETAPYGIGLNVLNQVSKTTGLKFKLYENNLNEEWHELINSFKAKKIHILPTVSYSEERLLFLDFTVPYIETSLAIIEQKDKNNHIHLSLESLKNHTIAIPKGYWLNEYLIRENLSNTDIYSVNSTLETFSAVSNNLADCTICEIPIFSYYREANAHKNLRVAAVLPESNPIMLGIQKDLPLLRSIINKVIQHVDSTRFFESSLVMPKNTANERYLLLLILLLTIIIIVIGFLLLKSLYRLILTKKDLEINISQKIKFMEDISHDLKTPIMITMGYIDTLADGETKDQARIQNYLKRVQSVTLYMQNLVNDLFTLSKLENNFVKLHKEKAYINEVIEEIVSTIRLGAEKKDIGIAMNLEKTADVQLEIDFTRMNQILANILYNAIKFTPNGGKIVVSTQYSASGKTHISIKDSGNGIPEKDLPYLFDRYYKSKNNIDPQSSGLGLCIAKQLVALHNGRIWAESQPGEGSTFHIEL